MNAPRSKASGDRPEHDPFISWADAINRCPLFSSTGPRLRRRIADAAIERHMGPHRIIALQGERFPYLGIVSEGSVEAVASSREGREQVLYEARAGETFAEIPMLDSEATLSRLAAGSHGAVAILIPKSVLESVCRLDRKLGLVLARATAKRARIVAECLADLAFEPTIERIAHVILARAPADAAGWVDASKDLSSLSQTELAELSGTVRVVAARALRTLVKAAAIELEHGRIKRVNPPAISRWL